MKYDYEIEITNRYGGTDFYIQTAETPDHAIELFSRYFNEPCTIRRVWNPDKESREEAKEVCIPVRSNK